MPQQSNIQSYKFQQQQQQQGAMKVTLWTHDQSFSRHDWVISNSLPFAVGDVVRLSVGQKSINLLVRQYDMALLSKQPVLQVSVCYQVAQLLGVQSRTDAMIQRVSDEDADNCVYLEYVQLVIRDQYIGRGDMFRLKQALIGDMLYVGQRVNFAAGVRASVRRLYSQRDDELTGIVCAGTKFIFRSESAKFFIFIQVCSDFDAEIVCQHLIALFGKWKAAQVNHVVSIVLCGRILYNQHDRQQLQKCQDVVLQEFPHGMRQSKFLQNIKSQKQLEYYWYTDHYKVIVDWETKQNWLPMMKSIYAEMRRFSRDMLIQQVPIDNGTCRKMRLGMLSPPFLSPVLESANLALNMFSRHYIDRDLSRTGLSIAIISQSHGYFRVPQYLLRATNERMIEDGICVDLICCLRRGVGLPLHTIPVFDVVPDGMTSVAQSSAIKISSKGDSYTAGDKLYQDDLPESFYMMPYWIDLSVVVPEYCKDPNSLCGFEWRVRVPRKWQSLKFSQTRPLCGQIPYSVQDDDEASQRLRQQQQQQALKAVQSDQRSNARESLLSRQVNAEKTSRMMPIDNSPQSSQQHVLSPSSNGASHSSSNSSSAMAGSGKEVGIQRSAHNQKSLPIQIFRAENRQVVGQSISPQHNTSATVGNTTVSALNAGLNVSPGRFGMSRSFQMAPFGNHDHNNPSSPSNLLINSQIQTVDKVAVRRADELALSCSFDPCCPENSFWKMSNHIRRWHHVFPQQSDDPAESLIRWTSLCSPACLPLTTDYFPTLKELKEQYAEYNYTVSLNDESGFGNELTPTRRKAELSLEISDTLLIELIAQRLMQGFQLVVGNIVIDSKLPSTESLNLSVDDRKMYYLSMGTQIHRLRFDVNSQSVEVTRYVKKVTYKDDPLQYSCRIWPKFFDGFLQRNVVFEFPKSFNYNWNYLDNVVSGYQEEFTDSLRHWRSRFVLIPLDTISDTAKSQLNPKNEVLTDEELRLAGFMKFIEVFHKARWTGGLSAADSNSSLPNNGSNSRQTAQSSKRDAMTGSSVHITYTTFVNSVYVQNEYEKYKTQDSESWISENVDRKFSSNEQLNMQMPFQLVAAAMQNPTYGLPLKDRRWHLRFYEKAFIGSEAVDWMIKNFSDINNRLDAENYGELMLQKKVIEHVNQRHRFLDGHYFYRLTSEYLSSDVRQQQDSRNPLRWFRLPLIQSSNEQTSKQVVPFQRIQLSKKLVIDMDLQRKSNRKEWAFLHYDAVHNPRNSYHFQIHWISCSSRMVEETFQSWQRAADKCGFNLVEAPTQQATNFANANDAPFHCPQIIGLKTPPPSIDTSKLKYKSVKIPKNYFEIELLSHFGFILDVESDDEIDQRLVQFSYSKPLYKNVQFIHKSGVAIVQVLGANSGFLWVQNRQHLNRNVNTSPLFQQKSQSAQQEFADQLRRQFIQFCDNGTELTRFWVDATNKLLSDSGVNVLLEDLTDITAIHDASLVINPAATPGTSTCLDVTAKQYTTLTESKELPQQDPLQEESKQQLQKEQQQQQQQQQQQSSLYPTTRMRALSITSSVTEPVLSPEIVYSSTNVTAAAAARRNSSSAQRTNSVPGSDSQLEQAQDQ
ncbi:hypothetical protein MP228_008869 [Amoeboaphelidium protococcarum]|nr:hypothetical protein MP228_008869 [Amoeboaphelidium protococcarum]